MDRTSGMPLETIVNHAGIHDMHILELAAAVSNLPILKHLIENSNGRYIGSISNALKIAQVLGREDIYQYLCSVYF